MVSGVSQRRAAKLLGVHRKTVERKFLFLGLQAKKAHEAFLRNLVSSKKLPAHIQFDEMETFERSKCLPLSIPLVVCASSRKILGFEVARMPANGPLAAISLKKYGKRKDERPLRVEALFARLKPALDPMLASFQITSDQNPKYPGWIRPHFPHARHERVKGRRGCVVGQGELKKIGFDPIFSLNHTAAMIRANVNRLFRRTWCTTKRADRLELHLALYAQFHNDELV